MEIEKDLRPNFFGIGVVLIYMNNYVNRRSLQGLYDLCDISKNMGHCKSF